MPKLYNCKPCNYKTNREQHLQRHLESKHHAAALFFDDSDSDVDASDSTDENPISCEINDPSTDAHVADVMVHTMLENESTSNSLSDEGDEQSHSEGEGSETEDNTEPRHASNDEQSKDFDWYPFQSKAELLVYIFMNSTTHPINSDNIPLWTLKPSAILRMMISHPDTSKSIISDGVEGFDATERKKCFIKSSLNSIIADFSMLSFCCNHLGATANKYCPRCHLQLAPLNMSYAGVAQKYIRMVSCLAKECYGIFQEGYILTPKRGSTRLIVKLQKAEKVNTKDSASVPQHDARILPQRCQNIAAIMVPEN
ncbi:unnamed protein product [Mytilus edulis]|uniref:Uncharacterized protein n=1 Tax=Mytilus edulis TaxID=6550 RepID=A0A8S3TCX1_MYTED|nr:unnamed protein product [Mytilus edulis]